jgi:hypothetical protein
MRSAIFVEYHAALKLEKRRWFYVAREILMSEGLDDVKVFVEPNETVPAEGYSENWFLKIIGWTTKIRLFGWYCNDDRTLHFTAGRSDFETFDTLLHETAHAIVHRRFVGYREEDHGSWWKFQFHLLKDKYRAEYSKLLLKENSRRLELAMLMNDSKVKIIRPREFHEGSNN